MKTKEELNALKKEVEALNEKLAELTEEEMELVAGGKRYPKDSTLMICDSCGYQPANWAGNYKGKVFDCPKCHEHAFVGKRYIPR